MTPPTPPEPIYFDSPAAFRAWLAEHHASADSVEVGFHKVGTGIPSLTWPESVDEALCQGWIDGVRHGVDEGRYRIRFTPRRPGSRWSAVNVRRVGELAALGRMRPAGLAAFEARRPEDETGASIRGRPGSSLDPAREARLRADAAAWAYFEAQPDGYRRTATFWVMDARKDETRDRRLEALIADSAAGRRIGVFARDG